jgi:thiosulfate/3-mercaptopyruvate sulfurtransferase
MNTALLIQPEELVASTETVIFDCRFELGDAAAGQRAYLAGHIPGAHYLDLEKHLSGPAAVHGGRHPLPAPAVFAATLAQFGVGPDTNVIAYDDSRLAYAARLWWMMGKLGFKPPRLLSGGYRAWLDTGGEPDSAVPERHPVTAAVVEEYRDCCDIDGLRRQQQAGATVIDSREERRYQGLEEPIDPVAGHIPAALNRCWLGVTDTDGAVLDEQGLRDHWGELLNEEQLVVYCGSGVTACVNLFSLALLGREDAQLYAGSWSDWCSWL